MRRRRESAPEDPAPAVTDFLADMMSIMEEIRDDMRGVLNAVEAQNERHEALTEALLAQSREMVRLAREHTIRTASQ